MTTTTQAEPEPLSAVLDRTAHLLAADDGPVVCARCGAQRSLGRRAGDPEFVCLAGCGTVDVVDELADLVGLLEVEPLSAPAVAGRLRAVCARIERERSAR